MSDNKTTTSSSSIVSGTSNERLLKHIESSGYDANTVDTSDLLDMLEKEVNKTTSSSSKSSSAGTRRGSNGNTNRRRGTPRGNTNTNNNTGNELESPVHSSDDSEAANDDNTNTNAATANSKLDKKKKKKSRRDHITNNRAGYASGDSRSSFTSSFFGGLQDDNDLLVAPIVAIEENMNNNMIGNGNNEHNVIGGKNDVGVPTVTAGGAPAGGGGNYYAPSVAAATSSDKITSSSHANAAATATVAPSTPVSAAASPMKNNNNKGPLMNGMNGGLLSNYNSDGNSSQQQQHASLISRPSFDNPFRSSTSLNRMSFESTSASASANANIGANSNKVTGAGGGGVGGKGKNKNRTSFDSDKDRHHHNKSRRGANKKDEHSAVKDSAATSGEGGGNFSDYAADVSASENSGTDDKESSSKNINNNYNHNNNSRIRKSGTAGGAGGASISTGGSSSARVSFAEEDTSTQLTRDTSTGGGSTFMNNTKSTHSSEMSTFSLGSLAMMSVSTRTSNTTRSSKSSRSSRSSHGSATTTSTQSSGSIQERRRRRELIPVKNNSSSSRKHHHRNSGSGSGVGSSLAGSCSTGTSTSASASASMASSSLTSGHTSGKSSKSSNNHRFPSSHHHRRSHRHKSKMSNSDGASSGSGSASSRNLYKNNNRRSGNSDNSNNMNGNLHDHHPIHYPKRSTGLYGYIEEGEDEDENDDEHNNNNNIEEEVPMRDVMGGMTKKSSSALSPSSGGSNAEYHAAEEEDLHSDEEGLFRRVNKVKNDMENNTTLRGNKNDFLDGLIASTTKRNPLTGSGGGKGLNGNLKNLNSLNKGNTNDHTVNPDLVSEGESSFLSDLLGNRMNNKSANTRQRKNKPSATGSVISTTISEAHESTTSTLTDTTASTINIYKDKHGYKSHLRSDISSAGETLLSALREPLRKVGRYYQEGGEIVPKNRKEWSILIVLALLLSPLVHVAVIHILGADSNSSVTGLRGTYDTVGRGKFQKSLANRYGESTKKRADRAAVGQKMAAARGLWAGSSQVMLSKSSSLKENFILIPDADWMEYHRNQHGKASSSFFRRKSKQGSKSRMPLPSVLNTISGGNTDDAMVLYTITASNGKKLPSSSTSDIDKANSSANKNLWYAIQTRLLPQPSDAWASWSHNSMAKVRDDGFTLMYPMQRSGEVREALTKLANEFGQNMFYEFRPWSQIDNGGMLVEDDSKGAGGSILSGMNDILIRRSILTKPLRTQAEDDEPTVVFRRVKDLQVEDELTMREWHGPPIEDIVWKKK